MSEEQFRTRWFAGIGIAVTIIGVVAALVIGIIATAKRILDNARRALRVAQEIVDTTRPIWELQTTNAVANKLLDGAKAIEEHATQVAEALEAPPAQTQAAAEEQVR